MLTPTTLDKMPEPMVQLMSELQDDIIRDICRRITKAQYLTPTAEWQLYKANQLRLSSTEVNRRIAKQLKVRERTVKELYTDAVKTAIHEDAVIYRKAISEGRLTSECEERLTSFTRSVSFGDTLNQGLKNTNGLMRNLTNSIAAAANRQLSDALDGAYLKVISGAFSPAQAIFEAVQKLGADGVKAVSYKSGRTDQVDVAVRRAILTGVNKTCCDMQLSLAKEMDSGLVEVSSHLGARPSHAEWQGQVYSLTKGHHKYPYFYDATGYGTGDGLGGWNCRHSFFPFFDGLSVKANEPTFSKAENLEEYNNSQRQRALERSVRKSKRELAALDSSRSAASDPELKAMLDRAFEKKSVALKQKEAALSAHCKKTGSFLDSSRVRVDGFGRSVSQKAVWANKKYSQKHSRGANSSASGNYDRSFVHKIGSIDFSDKKAVTSYMDKFEQRFVAKDKEYCLVIDKNGDIYVAKGQKAEVDTDRIFGAKMEGSYNLHTHPPDQTEFSFSDRDVSGAVLDGTAVMRAADTKYGYMIDFGGKRFTEDEVLEAIYNAKALQLDSFDKKGYTMADYAENKRHSIVEDICEQLGVEYMRWKRK